MTERTRIVDELQTLIDAVCDGTFAERDIEQLERLLRGNVEAQQRYLGQIRLDRWLRLEYAHQAQERQQADTANSVFTFPSAAISGAFGYLSSGWPMAYLVATVVLGISLVIGAITYVSNPNKSAVSDQRPVAGKSNPQSPIPNSSFVGRITGMSDCEFSRKSAVAFVGSHVPLGRKYSLSSGLMEITYDSGAKVVLQGPAEYEVDSAAGGFLAIGKLTARVEKRGEKTANASNHKSPSPAPRPLFSVQTPTATVTDLGTEFCVEVHKDNSSDVYLAAGMVEVMTRQGEHRQRLQTDGGMRAARVEADADGRARIVSVALDPSRFPRITSKLDAMKQNGKGAAKTLGQSNFDLSSEGWIGSESATGLAHIKNWYGNKGCIQLRKDPAKQGVSYFIASPMFCGDRSAAFGGRLRFRIFTVIVDSTRANALPENAKWLTDSPLVVLEGREHSIAAGIPCELKYNEFTEISISLNANGNWYSVPKNSSFDNKPVDQTPVSDDIVRKVLADIREMRIRADLLDGNDIVRLDDIVLEAPANEKTTNK